MAINFQFLICVKCNHSLHETPVTNNTVICTNCGTSYFIIDNKIPVMVKDGTELLVKTWLHYQHHINDEIIKIAAYEKLEALKNTRMQVFCSIKNGLESNLSIIKTIQDKIGTLISLESIKKYCNAVEKVAYTTDLSYLARDWSGQPSCENELVKIVDGLESILTSYSKCNGNLLLMGAGMGRIACELAKKRENIYAIDNSITMAYCYTTLKENDIQFYEINTKRVYEKKNQAKLLIAHMNESLKAANVNYLLGNALATPFANNSLDTVVSVFFTDVFPLSYYLREVKRVLKPGGLFIHFGPLEYHFESIEEKYSAEEVKLVFEEEGFTFLTNRKVIVENLSSPASMLTQYYKNWEFSARYNPPVFSEKSVIFIMPNTKFEITGNCDNTFEQKTIIKDYLENSLEVTVTIIELLAYIDGTKKVCEIISCFLKEKELEDIFYVEIYNSLEELFIYKILAIKNR